MNLSDDIMVKVNFRGGIVSSEQLRSLVAVMKTYRIEEVCLGERQNLYVGIDRSSVNVFSAELTGKNFDLETGAQQYPNVMSSYAAVNLFAPQTWLTESVFKEVLDTFDFKPRLKINIVDAQQGLVTGFDGEISFIPSSESNFWYLYIRNPLDNRIICWPELVYSVELGPIAKELQKHLVGTKEFSMSKIFDAVKTTLEYISREKKTELVFPRYILPNYEGIHRNGDQSWIGIKTRSGKLCTGFFQCVTDLCLKTSVGSIYLTPWRSVLVKNIKGDDLLQWEILLGKFGVNIRHSSFELNWRTPDLDREAEDLKRYLIKEFDRVDVRTYGILFAVETSETFRSAASIIIEMKPAVNLFMKIRLFWKFNVYHTEDFNPNSLNLVFAGEVSERRLLADKLKFLCKDYYKQLAAREAMRDSAPVERSPKKVTQFWSPQRMHKCRNCFTVYDAEFGDIMNNIGPGIPFQDLPEAYVCSVCGAPKNEFMMVRKVLLKETE